MALLETNMAADARSLDIATREPGSSFDGWKRRRLRWSFLSVLGLVFAMETILWIIASSGGISAGGVTTIHLGLVVFLGWALFEISPNRADLSLPVLSVLSTIFFGPLGTAGAWVLLASDRAERGRDSTLEEWYDRLRGQSGEDKVAQLYAKIVTGRARRVDVLPAEDCEALLQDAPLRQVQTMLGRITLNYHPDYLNVLSSALRCPEATIRVQAAAIIVKLLTQVKSRIKGLTEATSSHVDQMAANLSEARALVALGLLEQSDVHVVRSLAKGFCEALIAANPAEAPVYEDIMCEILFEEGKYQEVLARSNGRGTASKSLQRLRFLSLVELGRHREAVEELQVGNLPGKWD
jgi:hypothetical protein